MRGLAATLGAALAVAGVARAEPDLPGLPVPPPPPPVTVLRSAPVEDGFYLVPASATDGADRWREIYSNPGPWERRELYGQYRTLLSGGCATRSVARPAELPSTLIQVRRLGERYVLYDPCNGRARRLELFDDLLEFHMGIEPELIALTSAKRTPSGFELSGRAFGCRRRPTTLRVEALAEPGWYRIPGFPDPDLPWVTVAVARTLDVLVNVCNEALRTEYPFERGR